MYSIFGILILASTFLFANYFYQLKNYNDTPEVQRSGYIQKIPLYYNTTDGMVYTRSGDGEFYLIEVNDGAKG